MEPEVKRMKVLVRDCGCDSETTVGEEAWIFGRLKDSWWPIGIRRCEDVEEVVIREVPPWLEPLEVEPPTLVPEVVLLPPEVIPVEPVVVKEELEVVEDELELKEPPLMSALLFNIVKKFALANTGGLSGT